MDIETAKTTYQKYAFLRISKGVNDSQVSEATGIGKSTFSDWKSGRSEPKVEKLTKIAAYFGVTVDYFTNNEEEKPKTLLSASNLLKAQYLIIDTLLDSYGLLKRQYDELLEVVIRNNLI